MRHQQEAQAILADWRVVQHDLASAQDGTPEAWALHAEVERLRDAYRRLGEDALAHDEPALPPFPILTGAPASVDLGWTADSCPFCPADHADGGCGRVLPTSNYRAEGNVMLAYRCEHKHWWTVATDEVIAGARARAAKIEIEGGAPYYGLIPNARL